MSLFIGNDRGAFAESGGIPILEDRLICPVVSCGCENVHMAAVRVIQNYDIVTVTQQNRRIRTSDAHVSRSKGDLPPGRGTRVEIECWCEWGHTWTMSLQFHKGFTHVGCSDATESEPRRSLWRD